ncbi:MAG: hypothetical protein WD266_11985 [Balneolales bacterium]
MTINLDKTKARELITKVIDGEATPDETRSFLDFIAKAENQDIRMQYRDEKLIKEFLSKKCKLNKAPERLYDFLKRFNRKCE